MASRTLTLPQNTKGRDFVVGDIHGCFDLLDKALLAVNFDPAKDRLICVGDLINRGDRSPDCLHYLAQPWFHSIRGNHEEIFIRAHRSGKLKDPEVIARLPVDFSWALKETDQARESFCRAFEALPIAIEVETAEGSVGFVHANIPDGMGWDAFKKKLEQGDRDTLQAALWNRERIQELNGSGVAGVARVFFGHTPVDGGPKALGNCFFIDTGAVFKQLNEKSARDFYLTLIDIRANAADICNPVPTREKLIRTATRKNNGPQI